MKSRTFRLHLCVAFGSFLLVSIAERRAYAWGNEGHRIVCDRLAATFLVSQG